MTITLRDDPKYFDTRGLPEGMDPETLFQYRYDTLRNSATGLESLAYRLIPMSLIKSWAFALDPTHRFKIAPGTVTAANRTRYRNNTLSVTSLRQRVHVRTLETWSQLSNYKGIAVCGSPYLVRTSYSDPAQVQSLTAQQPLLDRIKDTTKRTRIIGSSQGELEYFKSTSNSPPRTSRYMIRTRAYTSGATPGPECYAAGGTRDYETGSDEVWTTRFGPTAAVLSSSVLDALKVSEIAYCNTLCATNATSLLKGWSPFSRSYSLARNIAELKDLPRSIAQAQQTMGDLKKLHSSLSTSPKVRDSIFDLSNRAASNIPGEYLSYHFGWKQLHKDLKDLLGLPEKLAKKINFLIKRSGKLTTFRSKRDILSAQTGVSGYVYDTYPGREWEPTHNSRIQRESQVRLVINATFDFPPVNVPHLRQRFYLDQVGLIPRFTDVYNIIPWTWLVDWFTGFGNYLEMIEEINHDPALINWGLISCHTTGKLTTEFSYINATQNDIYVNGVRVSPVAATNATLHHTSVLDYECQVRMNVARVYGVERTTEPSTLTGYRQSILAALLAQRIDNTRSGTFRPRS